MDLLRFSANKFCGEGEKMTVEEMIEQLSKYPKGNEVVLTDIHGSSHRLQ